MEYICKSCDKKYKSYQSLWNHNKNIHNKTGANMSSKVDITSSFGLHITENSDKKCNYCEKVLSDRKSRWRHEKTCKNKPTIDITTKLENKIEQLEKKIESLENNKAITTTNNNNTNNTNNGTINNNNVQIIINKIGTENINDLNEMEVKEIFANNMESLVKFIQHMNFNSRLPSNHNFCTTSLDGQYLTVFNTEKSEQQKERKKYFFEDLLSRSVSKMEQLYNKYKTQFNNMKRKKIEEDINTLKMIRDRDMNDMLLREMLKKLNLLSYNYKETVMKTWNSPDTIGNKEKTFEEDLDDDDSDIKDIEDIFLRPEYIDSKVIEIYGNDSDCSEIKNLKIKKNIQKNIEV
jgi:hypothetical protein